MTEKWSCSKCGKTLGIVNRGKVHIRDRSLQYVATSDGTTVVQAVCPRCSRLNEVVVPAVSKAIPQLG